MIDFKPIATTDKELLTSFILPSDEQDCDFSRLRWQPESVVTYSVRWQQ